MFQINSCVGSFLSWDEQSCCIHFIYFTKPVTSLSFIIFYDFIHVEINLLKILFSFHVINVIKPDRENCNFNILLFWIKTAWICFHSYGNHIAGSSCYWSYILLRRSHIDIQTLAYWYKTLTYWERYISRLVDNLSPAIYNPVRIDWPLLYGFQLICIWFTRLSKTDFSVSLLLFGSQTFSPYWLLEEAVIIFTPLRLCNGLVLLWIWNGPLIV